MASYQETHAARERLTARFGAQHYSPSSLPMSPQAAVVEVTLALQFPGLLRPQVRVEDLADAVRVLDEATEQAIMGALHNELMVLDTLLGAGWSRQRVGELLGYAPKVAAAQVGARIARLRRRLPGYESVSYTAPAGEGGGETLG